MVSDGKSRVYLFGGGNAGLYYANDLWAYDLGTGAWTMLIANGAAGSPEARFHHGMIWTGSNILMFGGSGIATGHMNDLWSYDPATNAWTQLIAEGVAGSPQERADFGFVWDGQRALLFGGDVFGMTALNDLWSYDPATNVWTQMIANGDPASPDARAGFMMVWDGTEAILFGGVSGDPSAAGTTKFNDVWWYSPSTNGWTQKIANGAVTTPDPSFKLSMVWDGAEALVVGGWGLSAALADVWKYDPVQNAWTQKLAPNTPGSPIGREWAGVVWDGTDLLLFGGFTWSPSVYSPINDLWKYRP
jgi:N-acetylneuraminic acid mutarotase